MLFSFQDKLIFYPVDLQNPRYELFRDHEITVESSGYRLQGWRFVNSQVENKRVLLYFGGNAEDVTYNFSELARFGVSEIYFFNYRGYGGSEGKPSQQALYEDSLAIYDSLLARGVNPAWLTLLGRSLGSAVATYLAAKRPVDNVILVTPFDSVTSLAKAAFPWLPVAWILRHPFPSTEYAKSVDRPMLMLVAAADEMILTDHSESLFRAWKGQKHWQLLQGVGHNKIQMHPDYYAAIQAFVQGGY